MVKTLEELRKENQMLRERRTLEDERRKLVREQRELKFGRAARFGKVVAKGTGRGFLTGLKALDRFVTPQLNKKRRK